ncbi:MAG: hypothetical protein H0Z39_06235 [Peptococcaceae bacterium]|nr:hypothetical protein [Peptococcaceae bacterium]
MGRQDYPYEEPGEEILEAVREASPAGYLTCPQARELAKKLGVPNRVIGRACDLAGVKIKDCDLGCF